MRLVALIATFEHGDQGCLDMVFRRCEDQELSGLDGIVNVVDRPEGSLEALEVIRFVEPLIRLAQGAIDRHRQTECWSDQ
jgi:hypothetical protein